MFGPRRMHRSTGTSVGLDRKFVLLHHYSNSSRHSRFHQERSIDFESTFPRQYERCSRRHSLCKCSLESLNCHCNSNASCNKHCRTYSNHRTRMVRGSTCSGSRRRTLCKYTKAGMLLTHLQRIPNNNSDHSRKNTESIGNKHCQNCHCNYRN